MKIKRLEIIGFKSFVDKVAFDFPEGITAIVGPNGCGKSNVVDAIRWVMGEQSAKNLRGRSMEDIIFGGSESRKPLGMAEVSLVFSTDDGRVPAKYLNFSEIQVTRRLYRDGDSEYFLNKTPCRLLDIHELFMDTGVGAKAYSVIEQGRIGMILLAKPEERRFLIEEAAGVTKFKARKQVALKKIELTRQNLLRIGDIVAEIKRQLNSLHRQAKKAERFRSFREELKGIELLFARRAHASLEQEKAAGERQLAQLTAELDAASLEVEKKIVFIEERRVRVVEDERALAAAQEEVFRLKGACREIANRIEFQRRELATLERNREKAVLETTDLDRQLVRSEEELKALLEMGGTYTAEAAADDTLLQEKEQELAEMTRTEQELAAQVEERRRDLFGVLSHISHCSNQRAAAAKRLDVLAERSERTHREEQSLRGRLAEAMGQSEQLEADLKRQIQSKAEVVEEVAELAKLQETLKGQLEQLERELGSLREERSRKSSRLHSLQELEAQRAGYGQGVRGLLLSETYRKTFAGIVADVVETDPEYEAALEAVLGERLQYVIGGGVEDAFAGVRFLKESSGGRCTFMLASLPVTAGVLPAPDEAPSLAACAVVAPEYREILEPLLESIFLAADLPAAAALSRRYPHLTFVTTAGDVAFGGGNIQGGSTEVVREGFIHKKREIKDLTHDVELLRDRVAAVEVSRNEVKASIIRVEEELRQKRQQLHQTEIRLVNADKDLLRVREECRRIEERLAVKAVEDRQLADEQAVLEKERQDAESSRVEAEQRKAGVEAALEQAREELVSQKERIGGIREAVTATKVRAAALREKYQANARAVDRTRSLIEQLKQRLLQYRSEQDKGEEERQRLVQLLTAGEDELRALLGAQQEAENGFFTRKNRHDVEASDLREEDERLKAVRESADELRRRLGERNLALSSIAMKLDNLELTVRERFRLDLSALRDMVDEAFDVDEKSRRQSELQRMIDELGEVNLMAIEEYQELEARFNFLNEQKADLEESLTGLQKAIQRINRTTRKRFLETFEQVNTKFMEVFPRLFCGGKAELRLTNEDDLLETGIEIIVQPPGKKLQNVSLLSGGEKALTAVALIFSIFLIKPSPFCLLDEVDAPLDDANIGRFNEMVKEMTSFSQFIMITHSKTTMMVADTLYGVTMEEPGISKLVSVRINR